MSPRPQRRYRGSAWAAGGFVFAALCGAVWWMLSAIAPGAAAESRELVARREAGAEAVRPLILPDLMAPAAPQTGGELVSVKTLASSWESTRGKESTRDGSGAVFMRQRAKAALGSRAS